MTDLLDGEVTPGDRPGKKANPFADMVRGQCKVCGADLKALGLPGNRYYCDEHQPPKKDKKPRRDHKPAGSPPRPRAAPQPTLAQQIEMTYAMFASVLSIRDPHCAAAISENAATIAERWVVMAENDPKVKAFLEQVLAPSGWLGLAVAHIPIVLAVWQHHGAPRVEQARFNRMSPADQRRYAESRTRASAEQPPAAAPSPSAPPGGMPSMDDLLEAWESLTPEERQEAARVAGMPDNFDPVSMFGGPPG